MKNGVKYIARILTGVIKPLAFVTGNVTMDIGEVTVMNGVQKIVAAVVARLMAFAVPVRMILTSGVIVMFHVLKSGHIAKHVVTYIMIVSRAIQDSGTLIAIIIVLKVVWNVLNALVIV